MNTNKIWYEDIQQWWTLENYIEILPFSNMSFERQLNAIFRFFTYLGVLLALVKGDYRYIFMPIVGGIVTVFMYEYERMKRKKAERFLDEEGYSLDSIGNTVCVKSTIDNPFMNPSIADITDNPERPRACNVTSNEVQQSIDSNFNQRVFQDVSDVFNKQASQREFYTVPNTAIPNDQGGFAQWLYGTGKTCKEGNGMQCFENLADDPALDSEYVHRRHTKQM